MKIGFFDSGLGGITIFNEALNRNIKADFLYLADNRNTPYGIKDKNRVINYINKNIEYLVNSGCGIIVIACNTATALCIKELRNKFPKTYFIGTEPAVKVAADFNGKKKILVTATSITLKEEKLKNLIKNLQVTDRVSLLPLDKLVEFAENNVDEKIVELYLKEKLKPYNLVDYSHIVLGCTHFPIYKSVFKRIAKNVNIIDGGQGIINNLEHKLVDLNLKKETCEITLALTKADKNFINNFNKLCKMKANEVVYVD